MIPMTIDDEEPGLCAIAAGRHARLQPRIAAYLACAVLLAPLAGWGVASVWAAGLVALAAGEAVSHRNKTHRPMGVSLAFLAGEGLVGGALGVGAVVNGGALGAACGVMFLTLALFSTGAARRGSAAAFVAGAGPLAAYLVLSAALAGRASERPTVTLALVLMAIAVCAVVAFVWKTCAEALAGELRARAEAERRLLEAEAAGRATAEFVALARSALTRPLQAVRGGADSLRRTAPALRAQAERTIFATWPTWTPGVLRSSARPSICAPSCPIFRSPGRRGRKPGAWPWSSRASRTCPRPCSAIASGCARCSTG
jgi:hypothetical protein